MSKTLTQKKWQSDRNIKYKIVKHLKENIRTSSWPRVKRRIRTTWAQSINNELYFSKGMELGEDTEENTKTSPGTERIYSQGLRLAKMDLEHSLKALRKQTIQLSSGRKTWWVKSSKTMWEASKQRLALRGVKGKELELREVGLIWSSYAGKVWQLLSWAYTPHNSPVTPGHLS